MFHHWTHDQQCGKDTGKHTCDYNNGKSQHHSLLTKLAFHTEVLKHLLQEVDLIEGVVLP
jgi:hypothetical protein